MRDTGAWEEWVEFFLDGVIDTAREATDTARKILTLFAMDKKRLEEETVNSTNLQKIYDYLCDKVFVTARKTSVATELSFPTVNNYLQKLEAMGIVSEFTGKHRDRVYVYTEYFALLKPGTDPLPR